MPACSPTVSLDPAGPASKSLGFQFALIWKGDLTLTSITGESDHSSSLSPSLSWNMKSSSSSIMPPTGSSPDLSELKLSLCPSISTSETLRRVEWGW